MQQAKGRGMSCAWVALRFAIKRIENVVPPEKKTNGGPCFLVAARKKQLKPAK